MKNFLLLAAFGLLAMLAACNPTSDQKQQETKQQTAPEKPSLARHHQRVDSLRKAFEQQKKGPKARQTGLYLLQALHDFAQTFPKSDSAPAFLYDAAQLRSGLFGDHPKAAETFRELNRRYPEYAQSESALFNSVILLWKSGKQAKARNTAKYYMTHYPKGEYKKQVKQILDFDEKEFLKDIRKQQDSTKPSS